MNLNDFVVPNNKTRSVKLNARNLQKLQLGTTTLANEHKNMEEKLEQLKENMSKEKEERGHFTVLGWRFGECISSNSNSQPNSFKRTNDNTIQKLSAGKMKIRVLKNEPLTAPPQLAPSPSVPNSGLGMMKRSRVKGTISRQCEVKTAKLTDAQAQVISQDVSCFQRQIKPGSFPGIYIPESSRSPDSNHSVTSPTITTREDERPKNRTKGNEKQMKILHNYSQVLVVKHGQEKAVGVTEDDKSELADSVFTGQYSEEESARSFQEAVMQWRKERSDGKGNLFTTDVMWTPMRPDEIHRNASDTSTQTDLPPDGQKRGAEGKQTVKLEFFESSLTYMDRLLLKKHRRTPVESSPPLAFGMGLKSLPTTDAEDEMATSLTAEEEDFRQYCSSLFNVPVRKDSTESQVSTPGPGLVIEVLDEISGDKMVSFTEKKLDNNRMTSKADHSSPRLSQQSRSSITVEPKTGKKPHCPHDQNPKNDDSLNASPSDCRASAGSTARTSKKSARTATPSRSISSPTRNKSIANCGSPQCFPSLLDSQFKTHNPSQPPVLLLTDVSILDGMTSVIPEEHLSPSSSTSFPLRSTFSVSPSGSTECVLFPKVYHSTPQQKGTEKTRSSQLFAEAISSLNFYETPRGNLISPQQFQLPSSDPDCLLLDNQLPHSLSPDTVKPQPISKALETIISIAKPVPNNGPPHFCHTSVLKYEDAPVLISLVSGDNKSAPSCKEVHCTSSYLVSNATDNPLKIEDDKERLEDSGDKMTSDCLCLTPPEDDSCGEEAWIYGHLSREKSKEMSNNLEMPYPEDSFRLAKKNSEKYLQTEDTEQWPETQMVMQNQTAGFGSEQFCDLDGFSPLGLDTDTGHPDSPEQTHCDRLHTCQFSVRASDPTVHCSHSSLGCHSEEYLLCEVMKDSYAEPTGIQMHSTIREEMSANELRTSEFGLAGYPLSQASQVIMEICGVDQAGCEDPDVDTDMATRMLHSMEQELQLLGNTQCIPLQALGLESEDRRKSQDESPHFKWCGPSKEQNQEEETVERDRQSVLLLP